MSGTIRKVLILPHLKIHNANALSSPFTIGFPAMTAWLGAVHALQRKLNANCYDVSFEATGVVSHQMDLQVYKGENDFVHSIVGTGNPLDKTGSRPAFIEEARCHLEASILIEFNGLSKDDEPDFIQQVSHLLHAQMKIAGGDIKTFNPPVVMRVEDGNDVDIRRLTRKLMPGYVLIERRDLLIEAMSRKVNALDALDGLIDYLTVHHHCEKNENGDVTWHSSRKAFKDKPAGWIVPIATGFHGISELAEAKNQRDADAPHRFAESVVTLGEFKMPHRFHSIDAMLWRYHHEKDNNLYLCQQRSAAGNNPKNTESSHSINSEFE